jgi:hypothetical protein
MASSESRSPDRSHCAAKEDSSIIVRHCLEVKQVRFMYTNKVKDLIVHHLIRGFNFKQFRQTKYAELNKKTSAAQRRDFLNEYKLVAVNPNQRKSETKDGLRDHLVKEPFFCFILEDPQISCQNTLTKS